MAENPLPTGYSGKDEDGDVDDVDGDGGNDQLVVLLATSMGSTSMFHDTSGTGCASTST